MASLDDFQEKVGAAIEQAKPFVEGAINAGAQFAEKADEWASSDRPGVEGAFEAAGGVAAGAVEKLADGANVAYEFIKDRVEEVSRQDIDGDGQIGKIKPEDVVAGAELASEAVAGAIGKTAEKVASAPGDIKAGLELTKEAVADAAGKAAAAAENATLGDMVAGAELAAEAVAGKVEEVAGNVAAGAELAAEALADAAAEEPGAPE